MPNLLNIHEGDLQDILDAFELALEPILARSLTAGAAARYVCIAEGVRKARETGSHDFGREPAGAFIEGTVED